MSFEIAIFALLTGNPSPKTKKLEGEAKNVQDARNAIDNTLPKGKRQQELEQQDDGQWVGSGHNDMM